MLANPDSLLWSYGWKSFLDIPFQDGNGERLEILVTTVTLETIYVNDGSTFQAHCNRFGEIVPLASVFLYAIRLVAVSMFAVLSLECVFIVSRS